MQGRGIILVTSDGIEVTTNNRYPNEERKYEDGQESAAQQRDPEKSTPDKINTGVNHVATGLRSRNSLVDQTATRAARETAL